MDQINTMAFALAELQTALDVYIGLFEEETNVQILSKYREISTAIRKSLSVNILIGCAALFTDPAKSQGEENMSFNNIYDKYQKNLSDEAIAIKKDIESIVTSMKLKTFRNKHVGHYGLEEKLGKRSVDTKIKNEDLKNLMNKGQELLNLIIRDAKLTPPGSSLAYYTPIQENRSTKLFLDCLRKYN